MRVGIIGAGLAGLTAAYELRKSGFDLTVFEASERIGGRVYTHYFDPDKKLYGELGAMRFPRSHSYTMHYINEFGLQVEPFALSSDQTFIYVKGTRVRNDSQGLGVSEYIYPLFSIYQWEKKTKWFDLVDYVGEYPISTMPIKARSELVETKWTYSPYIDYWDCVSTKKAMGVLGLSYGAMDMISSIDPTFFPFWYDSHIEFMNQYYTKAFKDMLKIKGGFSLLPQAFYKSLTSEGKTSGLGQVDFRFSSPVSSISYDPYKGRVVLNSESFDYVVCAIPFSSLRNISVDPVFSSIKHQAIRELNYTESQKTLLLCKRRFWQDQGIVDGGGSVTDLPISSIWYPSYGETEESAVLLASYNLNKDARRLGTQPIDSRIEMIKRQVEEVHGLSAGYLDEVVEDFASISWGNEPYELGCFLYFQPQQKKLFSKAMTTPEYDGRILFAGEHVSVFHGWMNGALESGARATKTIFNALSF